MVLQQNRTINGHTGGATFRTRTRTHTGEWRGCCGGLRLTARRAGQLPARRPTVADRATSALDADTAHKIFLLQNKLLVLVYNI